ncbi:YjdF family protein [Blautia producta]|nr:YjdF family protein [Blautia producta]
MDRISITVKVFFQDPFWIGLCERTDSMYQMKVDDLGFLVHTWFGKRTPIFDYSYLNV